MPDLLARGVLQVDAAEGLQAAQPQLVPKVGDSVESLEVELKQAKMLVFTETVGRLRAMCLSPTKALLRSETPEPMTKGELERMLSHFQ